MQRFGNYEGWAIRLTEERLMHIMEHPEMRGLEEALEETLAAPEEVVRSLSDTQVRLYYRRYTTTRVGDKYLCVVVKEAEQDTFVITAYLTDEIKQGEVLWARRT